MSTVDFFPLLSVLAYALPFAVAAVLLYLVIRFGVRDGLRGHERWLERRRRTEG